MQMQNNNSNINSEYFLELRNLEEQGDQRLSNDFTMQSNPENTEQIRCTQSLTPIQTGMLFGISRVMGDVIADKTTGSMSDLSSILIKTGIMHLLGKGVITISTKPQIPTNTNYTVAQIKSFLCENFGAIVSFLTQEAGKYLTKYEDHLDKKDAALLSDFILLGTWFCSGKMFSNKLNPLIDSQKCIKAIQDGDITKFQNVSKKNVYFFMDVIASCIAATACIYATPSKNDNITDTIFNGMICGTTFSTCQQSIRALLQIGYNKLTGNNIQR
jgi:hypothetical protein